ncbi:hypothetical protein N1031_14590 [Herbiconiux moechotypicola]|uniref:Glycosyltransferase RgtA/B/C/D-like domain-containing protein n=1 Tax=Herbiconiux moechotypicola TaxID=637393 RepID=A0ABN3DVF4_9MICO|nr:hypothetical protein [Herbiconiux moechotypicola]MCS5730991.1 hypothetical protein [Herbiconiux moechotypicola]
MIAARRILPYPAAALLALAAVWFGLDLWRLDWSVPLAYSGDALAVASHVKTVLETGWFTHQPALGAPYGQYYSDYPQADNLHFVVFSAARWFTSDVGVVMNGYFVAGFPLAAVTATWFLRRAGVKGMLAVALGVVFAIAPYHFVKGEGHLFLSAYFVVPLALDVILRAAHGLPLWSSRVLSRRNVCTVGSLVLLGTASSYYSVFTAVLLAVAGLATLWRTRRWRVFGGAAAAGLVIAATLAANLAPSILYRAVHGANESVLVRSPPEAELYSFKLAALLLPVPGHRFPPFAELRRLYDEHYPLPSEEPALGLLASAGLGVLIVVGVFLLLSAGRPGWRRAPGVLVDRLAVLAGLAFVAFLFGTVGGLATPLSFVGFPVRSWNRIAIFLALVALTALGLVLGLLVERVARRRVAGAMVVACSGLLVVVAVWDQIPPVDTAARARTVAEFRSDAEFVGRLERSVAPGCLLYQLPYIPFPESPPVNGVTDSDQLRLFLHSTSLRWSGGGIKGRGPVDRAGAMASLPVSEMVEAVEGLGACGLVIDRVASAGTGATVLDELERLGVSGGRIVSRDGRFVCTRLQT